MLLLALQIFNLSISAIDFQPIHIDTSFYEFNDLETILEYISEVLLDHKNSFPEPDKPSSSSQTSSEKHAGFKLVIPQTITVDQEKEEAPITHSIQIADAYLYRFFKEVTPPPPKC